MNDPRDARGELLEIIRVSISANALDHGVPPAEIEALLIAVENDVRARLGGAHAYVPAADRRERNRRIIADWQQRMTQAEIARRHGVDQATVSRVITRHASQQRRRTGFGSEEWAL